MNLLHVAGHFPLLTQDCTVRNHVLAVSSTAAVPEQQDVLRCGWERRRNHAEDEQRSGRAADTVTGQLAFTAPFLLQNLKCKSLV